MRVRVYVLVEPELMEIRYVGVTTKSLEERLSGHIYAARRGGRARRFIWIRSLLDRQLKPLIQQIDETDLLGWPESEQYWIEHLTKLGCDLVNGTAGGRGALKAIRSSWSEEAKARHSALMSRIMSTPEARQRTSEATKLGMAKYFSEHAEEWSVRQSAVMNAYYSDVANRAAVAERSKNSWSRPGAKEALSEKMKQIVANEKRVKCPSCDMISRPAGIANHRKAKGH